ncbi:MAG: peptidoglycan-binding protein [Frankia sp.]
MRRTSRRLSLAGGLVVLVGTVVAATLGLGGGRSGSSTSGSGEAPPATVAVKKGTLTQAQNVGGILSYGEPVALVAPVTSGVVTWVAAPGTVVRAGEPVYRVDDEPVVLIHGSITPYRTLHEGDAGADVNELKAALAQLGFGAQAANDTFDAATTQAVKAWQAELHVGRTGTVAPDQITVAVGDIRIASQQLPVGSHLGTSSNQTVLTYSGTTRVATIPLDVDQQQFVKQGNAATITLPDGTHLAGTVGSVGKVAQTIKDKQIINVIVGIADQKALGSLDAAPVSLRVVTGTRTNVLVVPVEALLALPGGGYGLEVVGTGTTSYVPVKAGMFAGGLVEVGGAGIGVGTIVGVAK